MVFQFKPTTETHDLKGKIVLVTGGSAGVGKESCKVFARLGAHLIIAARNKEKTEAVINELKVQSGNENIEFLCLDLATLASVKEAATSLLKRKLKLDILMNNAGIAALPGLTTDGFELQFGTNHLGPFLFTELLLPLLNKETSRIVMLSSKASESGVKIDFEKVRLECKDSVKIQPYNDSKLANAVYAKHLAGRGYFSASVHPGVVATEIWKAVPWPFQSIIKWFMLSEEEGAYTQLYCALEAKEGSGLFWDNCKSRVPNSLLQDEVYAQELYDKSRLLVKAHL